MESIYFVASLRMAGWWGVNSMWTTDFSQVKKFDRDGAINFCKARYAPNGEEFVAVPVREDDLMRISNERV